jgi:hypothetical protein
MISKSRTVAQLLLRLSTVTWLTVKRFHNITTCASVTFLFLLPTPVAVAVAVTAPRFVFGSVTSLAQLAA